MPKKKRVRREKSPAAQEMSKYEKILPKALHEPGAPPCLVIDGMNLAYSAYYAYSRLTHKGKSVSMLFGFPQMLKSLINSQKPRRIIVVWDGVKHPKRLELLPGYKGHREAKRDPKQRAEFFKQIEKLRKLLYYMGIPQVRDESIEGDDMIYLTVKRELKRGKVLIVSGDKDFLQLVNWDVSLLNPRNKYGIKITPFAFSTHEPYVELDQVVDYLCLVGDSSDDIPGVRGIGPSRAKKFLGTYNSIKDYLDDEDALYPGLADKDNLKKVWKRNRAMIDLAYFNKRYNKGVKVKFFKNKKRPKFNKLKYLSTCAKYNLKTMITETFIKTFEDGKF